MSKEPKASQKSPLKPVGKFLVVREFEPLLKTAGGLFLSEKSASREFVVWGEVLAVGEGTALISGHIFPPPCKVGDTIMFTKNMNHVITDPNDGKTFQIIECGSVLGVWEGGPVEEMSEDEKKKRTEAKKAGKFI